MLVVVVSFVGESVSLAERQVLHGTLNRQKE